MRKKFLLMTFLTLLFTAMGTSVLRAQESYVAKVGDNYYTTLVDAIAASTPNGWGDEVTLLQDITLVGGYTDPSEGLRIEQSVTINGAGHTIDCGTFNKGIRIYQNGDIASNVMFKNINIVNNNYQGRCIDTRSAKINLMLNGGVNLTAHGTNSQPLTIGGSETMTKVTISGGTIDAGTSGYGVICFVPVTNHINVQGNAVIKGFAAFYLKEDVNNTSIKLSQSKSIGTNEHASASGVFGAVVIEGSNNTVRLEHDQAVVKAVAGDGAEMAPQAAFLLKGNDNTVGYYNATPQVITEGDQSYFVMAEANATGTKFVDKGIERKLVAENEGYQFYSFEEAVRFAGNEGTIKVVNDFELAETWTVDAGQNITLDLNGKTINAGWEDQSAGKHIYAFTNNGTLTIKDSSTEANGVINARGNYNYGTLTLEEGTINAIDHNGGYGIQNLEGSTFTMNGGLIATTNEDGDIPGNGYDATTVRVDNGAEFIMNGGKINNISNFTIAIENYGTTTINENAGEVKSVHTTVGNHGTMTIYGGTFICDGLEGITAHALWATAGSTTTINGGTFNGKDNFNGFNVDASAGANVEIYGGNFLSVHSGSLYGDGTITVSGGTFFDAVPEERCAEGYIPQDNDNGTYGVVHAPAYGKVAKIGDVYYETLAEAVAAAQSGATITLLNGEHELPLFAGKELTFKGESKDGVIVNDAPAATTQGWNGSTFHFENLTAKGATANYHGLANGVVAVTYKDCNINGLRFLYATEGVSFEKCAFNAEGVEHSFWTYGASNVTVTRCTFTYTDRAVNCYSENGANHELHITFSDCDFEYDGSSDEPAGAVEINSSSVKSMDVAFTNDCTAPAKGAMWFNSQWDPKHGANTVVEVDGVVVWTAPAKIGETKYATLQEAVDAAQDGDVVTLIADVTEDEVLITQKADVDVTIDGDDKTFTGHMTIFGSGRHTGAETLTIKNVVFKAVNGKGECIASATNINGVNSYAHNVTIDGCSFNGNDTYSADNTFAIRFPSGGVGYDLTVTGCTADNKMFGLLWVTQVVGDLIVNNCTAEGVTEGIVLTSTAKATITNTTIDASNVAIRAGQAGAADGTINEFTFNNNTLKSDAIAIQIRGNATDANLSMTENVVSGTPHISGNTADTNISADANYWGEGLTGPVVDGTNVDVNSYYADEAREQLIVTALTLQQFVEKVTEGNGTYNGTFTEGGVEKNITVKVVPVSGDARTTDDVRVPNRLQKYTNPEVYYAQYQRFSGLTDVNISNVNFVFYPAAVTVTDAWNTAGATTTADNINGELQLLNTGSVLFENCSFEKMSVSPINAATLSVTSSEFNGLDAYAIKDVKAITATITGTTFTDCNGGFWFNNAPTTLTVTDNTFTGTGRRGAIQFSANGDYANTEMTVTGNEVTDEAAFLWQLNNTISNAQLNAILDKNNNTYETAFVAGSVELHLQGEGTADNPYLINDISDLEFFRDDVNAGNDYEGKYIKVTATEIDLNNEEWTPIAYMGKTFKGNFDGNNVTVKDLKITKALTNSAENNGIGFFGRTDSPATIENIIIENVDITGSLYVGAIVGLGYTGKHVKGCKVKGNIAIDAWWYAGVIGGNGYMNLVDDCHVIGNNGSYIKGNGGSYIGGIWGFRGEGNNKITNCTVENLDIIGVDRVGGICGIGHYGNTISGCDAEDVTVTATDPEATTIGLLVGATQGNVNGPTIFEDNDASGITAQIDNGDGTYTEVTNLYGTNIDGGVAVTNYVAQIVGGTQYPTLAEAVAAAVNNDVITLLPTNAPIAMNASLYGKDVTITGNATVDWSKGFLFVGRGGEGNATLTFESANLTSASNQATYGIHVSGREKDTNDKYDGTLVINYSTIELDYLINKGTMTLDNSTLTVKNGFSVGGRPAGETESGEDATATITLNNNSKVVVNRHNGMGLGYEAIGVMNVNSGSTFETTEDFLITANGTMNVNGGNVKTVGTLTNNGAVNVTGNASMNVNTLTGNAINFTNVTIANANIGGAVNAFGTNNFTGETTIGGILSLGYETNPTEQVVVNITGNFNGVNVLIGSSNEHVLNVGNAESEKSTAHFGQIGAFGDVNIVNADVTYGYAFIRNDFNVTNSTMAINGGVNTYFSGNAKVVVDNSLWNLSGYANIGSYGGYMYGNADITLKNGSSMTATNLGIQVDGEKVVKLTLEDSSTLTATNLSNQGEIVLANVQAKVTSNELTGTNNVPTTTVADHKVVYENGAYVVTAKHYVAQVKGTDNNVRVKFETFAEALDAVENGETIELLGTEGSEISKELEFTKDIEFTITGTAPNYALPVVTFQNAKVNIKDAEILIPELDARQNATINVINSTIVDAGGNSIVKSYYNGAINIDANSTVYAMQVTTMGYITVAGTLNATWQTNVYGNGLITLNNGATFNTAALHLTGQDYNGRDNTDAERVGKPAEIVVDGANFTVGNVHSAGGADYSYNSSKGINVGTVEGKSAILNIKNGGNVNIYMANGETANIGAGGTVNIAASTLNTICRAENGTVTLANNGNVYVTGEANLAANVTGAGWFYMNGVALDADTKLHGAKVGFINGVNTIVGSTIDNGFFSVGIGQNAAATTAAAFAEANGITLDDVTVNVSENAIIGGNGETYSGWVGSAYSADKTQHTYTLNVENSLAAFGYMHVSKDGIMYINGRSADDNKYTQDNSNVNFYAGDLIVNGNLTINNADAWVRYTKMSVDHADGVLNITGDTKYESSIHNGGTTGTSLVFYNAGNVNIANGTTIEIDNATTLVDGAELNIASANVIAKGDVDVTGNGAINFTALTAKLTAQDGLTIVDEVIDKDYKIVYQDGTYQFVAKQFVAQIYDVNNNTNDDRRYESLQEAIEAVAEGETVKLMADVTITEPAYGQNALNHARAINFTLDLNSKTLSANTGNSVFRFNIAGSGATDDVTVTIKNGKVVSGANTWCTLMSSGISADVRAVMNLEDLVIENYKGGDFAVKAWANGVVNAEGVTINSTYGGGFYALGGEITLDDCTVNQEGLWTAPYNSMAVGVSNGGKMTVKSGTYSAVPLAATDGNNQGTSHGSWTGGVMSSGGTLIINGGTFSNGNIGGTAATNPRELFIVGADADYGDNVNGQVIINGGTFTSIGDFIHCETIWGSANDPANTYMPTMGVTITAGDFTAVAGKTIGGCDPVSTGNPVDVEISGGTYGANHAIENSYLVVGYIVVDNGNGTYTVVEDQVAKIGDVTYKLLQEAIDAAQYGDEIVVLKDITLTEGIVIPADKTVTLDLAGCTVKQEKAQTEGYAMITNVGTLTIKDSSNPSTGKLSYKDTGDGGNGSFASNTIQNHGHLTILGGRIENLSEGQVVEVGYPHAIDHGNYSTVYTVEDVTLDIQGGTISNAHYSAIRMFCNSTTYRCDATISGGTIENAIDFQLPNAGKLLGSLTITGGTFNNINGKTTSVRMFAAGNANDGTGMIASIEGGTFNGTVGVITQLPVPESFNTKVIKGGKFSATAAQNTSEDFLAEGFAFNDTPDANGYYTVIQVAGTQTREFAYPGWYWFSTYIDFESGEEGLDELQEQLGDNAATIKGQTAFTNYQYYNGVPFWTSALTSISASEMYMIKTTNKFDEEEQTYENVRVSLEGDFVDYESYEITIHKGWNWIGYPLNTEVSMTEALTGSGFTPAEGDMIKGKTQGSSSSYNSTLFGGWYPDFNMIPGEGYMYYSAASENKTLTYRAGNRGTQNAKTSVEDNHWIVDEYKYSNNMTVIAMLSIDGEIVKGNYEVAAFANGECRGSARPIYIESIDAYVLFMTIHGDEVEELTFMYYDIDKDTEYELNNVMNYSNDAIVGTIDNPYIFSMNILGIGENSIDNINIYPNPTTTDREINLQATCDKVEVFNALGVKVAEYHNVDTLDALETAGIYVIRITNDNAVKHCRLVVK